jgi:signal transduction histidine kinase
MKLLSTLQNRIFVASALVAVLSLGFAVQFVTSRVSREAEAELSRGLRRAGSMVEENYTARLETLTLLARLVADLPRLQAAVETDDPPTVDPVARDYQALIRSDLFVLTGRHGGVLAAIGVPSDVAAQLPVRATKRGDTTTIQTPRGVIEVVTVPIAVGPAPPEIVGTLSLGFALDEALAVRFKAVTDSEVAFAFDGRIRASSLAGGREAALDPALSANGVVTLQIGGDEYVALRHRLSGGANAGGGAPEAVILRSRSERLLFVRALRTGLLVVALVGVLLAVLMSYAVARTVTRPLATITDAMREMAATGDFTRRIRARGSWHDEDARLLASTFDSLTEAIGRFQREASQRERLSALGRLSTVIAHEVRNPLMIIKSSLRTLDKAGVSSAELREAASDIDHEVARLDRIVGDVLDFARPVRLEYSQTDVNALLVDAAASVMSAGAPAGVSTVLEEGLHPIFADGERLRTVLMNVLSNALQAVAARNDGAQVPVLVRSQGLPGGGVAIEIEDRGVGIDAEDLPHVFEPYFTTKRTGTGLGLAIAKNVVDSHGGVLSAMTVPGGGTRVRVELPESPRSVPA